MAKANSTLSQSTLMRLFEYNAATGIFTRLHSIHGNPLRKEITEANSNGYIAMVICGRKEYAHRMAWLWVYGIHPSGVIDHINGIKTDNRIENIRDVTQQANLQNRKKIRLNSKSEFRGVRPSLKKWSARITVSGKEHHIGSFDTREDAYAAYLSAKRLMHDGCTI